MRKEACAERAACLWFCRIAQQSANGLYHPATIVKDAQRHGLRVKPVDVTRSEWNCSLERDEHGRHVLRIGLSYVRGLQQLAGEAVALQRSHAPFCSVQDLVRRVPQLSRANLTMLARIGALNNLSDDRKMHRRDALWQVECATHKVGPLLEGVSEAYTSSPLSQMNVEERLVSDYHGTGLTVGPHPMAYRRSTLTAMSIIAAEQLKKSKNGTWATVVSKTKRYS
jgi:error-prone DNA polymerase